MCCSTVKTVHVLTAGDLWPLLWTACCWIDRVTSARRHLSRGRISGAQRQRSGNLPVIDGGRRARSELRYQVTPESAPTHPRASGADPPLLFDAWWITVRCRGQPSGQVKAAGKLWRRLKRIYRGKVSTGLRGVSANNCCSFIFYCLCAGCTLETTDGCRQRCRP